jgi:hypothetical protein
LEIYIWVAISSLRGIEVKRGLDKNFPQVASRAGFSRRPTSRNKREKWGTRLFLCLLRIPLGFYLVMDTVI